MSTRPSLTLCGKLAALALLCSACWAAAQAGPASAAEAVSLSARERAWLDAHPVVTLATYRDGAPYGFVDEQGGYVGVIPDIVSRVEQLLGIRIRYKPLEYDALLDQVRSGAADLVTFNDPADMPYGQHYLKTQEFLFFPYALFVPRGSDLADKPSRPVTGRTIALVKGWDPENPSLAVLRGNRFVFGESMLACVNLVLQGRADGFFDVHSMVNYLLWKNGVQDLQVFRVYNEGYPAAFFVRREWPELKSALQKALAAVSRQERAQLLVKWNAFMGDASGLLRAVDLRPAERRWLREHPVIRVGMDPQWPPVSFVDAEDRRRGIAMDYLLQIEKMLGVRFEITAERPGWELADLAGRGGIDMMGCAVATPGASGVLLFTKPYLSLPAVILTRLDVGYIADLHELDGRWVGVVRGHPAQQRLARDYPGIELVPASSVEEMLEVLADGRVQACIATLPGAGYQLGRPGRGQVKVSGQTPYVYRVCMAVRSEYAPLAGILQKALDAIPADQQSAYNRKWMAVARERVIDYGLLWKLVLPLLALVAVFAYWTRRLAREVRARKRAEAGLRAARETLEQRVAERTAELEQAAHTLRESQGRFKAITENTPDAIIIADTQGIIRYCNRSAETMFGYGPGEMIGQSRSIMLPERLREPEQRKMQSFVGTDDLSSFCIPVHSSIGARRDGTEFPIEFPFFSWEAGGEIFFTAIIRDITERRQAVASLQASQERFSKMAASIQDGLAIVENGKIVYCNDRLCSILGCTRAELPRFIDLEFIDPQDRDRVARIAEQARATGEMPAELEYWIVRGDGTRRCIHNRYTVKEWQGGLVSRYVVTTDITDRKNAETALQKEQERLSRIIMTSPVIICGIAGDGSAIFINKTGEAITGYSSRELAGRNWWDLFYPGDLRGQVDDLLEKFKGGDVADYEMTLQTKSGDRRTIMWNSLAECDDRGQLSEMIGFGNDITERKKAEDEVRQARDYLETLIRTSPDAIVVTDPYGTIIMANESVEGLYGYRPEELIGQHAAILTPEIEKAQQASMALMEELFEKGVVRGHNAERQCKDGRIVQVESSVVLLKNPDGSVAGGISASRDVTERRRLEEQLRQSQKMQAIGTLAGGIAHDFNNILGVIFGYTELSHDLAAGNGALENNLTQIYKAAERARDLVRQILAFSRKSDTEVKPLQTHLILKECLKLLRASLPATVAIRMDIDEADDIIMADPTEMHQIVMNLCTNAAHAMQQAGGTLEIRLTPLDIDEHCAAFYSGLSPGPYVQLSVRDTGCGMSPQVIERIFDPFFTTKDVGKGTGMGLAVVHGIVKSLRGDIKVYSEPGRGSVFHVLLPRVREAGAADAAEPAEAPGGNESILLVDDEQLLLRVGRQMLGGLGYRVTAVQSPQEALELFKQDPAAFDIVITDQTMPGLTGYELSRELLRLRPGMPIVLCTGYSDLVTAESAIAGGIRAFVLKPLNRQAIAETIRRALDEGGRSLH